MATEKKRGTPQAKSNFNISTHFISSFVVIQLAVFALHFKIIIEGTMKT